MDKSENPEPSFIFHHIPKTAGTSFMNYLHAWFGIFSDYEGNYASNEEYLRHPVDFRYLSAATILSGHWNTEGQVFSSRYPEAANSTNLHKFTVFRDPFEMQKSYYYFICKTQPEVAKTYPRYQSLKKYFSIVSNPLAELLECNEENFQEVLDQFFFIGLAQDLELSLQLFALETKEILSRYPASLMARRQICVMQNHQQVKGPMLNQTDRDYEEGQLSANDLEGFREKNALDYRLYEIAKERFDAALAKHGLQRDCATGATLQENITENHKPTWLEKASRLFRG